METQDTVDTQTVEQTATSAPAASETSTPAQTAETSSENAETKAPETEQSKPEGDESSADDDRPRKLSRSERMRRRMQAMATELETLRATIKPEKPSGEDSAPKESDYNGDYFAYQTAKAAHDAAAAVAKQFAERDQRESAVKLAQIQREAAEEFFERVEELKPSIPDYDAVIDGFAKAGGTFAPHVVEELRDSEKGPMLAYQLAKNPALVAQLNTLSPRDAAREIGRLEASVSLPKPKKQTQAPAPLTVLKGGAAPASDLASLAKSDDATAYIAARRAQQKARA